MAQLAIFTYGLLTMFVLSGASRNRRLARPHPPVLQYTGYTLMGSSATVAAALFAYAGYSLLV